MTLNIGTRRALLRGGQRAWSVQFYQQNDGITFGSGVNLDDLFVADCTIETWVYSPQTASGVITYILTKNGGGSADGWRFYIAATGELGFVAFFATNEITIISPSALGRSRWHHVAVDFDFGTLTARLFLGGVQVGTDVAVGAYLTDAARNLICNGVINVGTVDNYFQVGPIRLSNSRRYTGASFSPPTMNNWPANDANAQLLIPMNDGAGVTATDYSGNSYDGTITFGANTRWVYGRI